MADEAPITWTDVRSFDDLIQPETEEIIKEAEKTATQRCPDLKRKGRCFLYCGLGIRDDSRRDPHPNHPAYMRHQGTTELQLWCLSDYEKCMHRIHLP